MATEKQIAANRANATRSTGPKTAAGKLKASRNAYCHGLSRPLPVDPLATARIEAIVQALVGSDAPAAGQQAAREWAEAQLQLLRVRSVRAQLWAGIGTSSADALHRLASIDRYETQAVRRRRRALRDL
jgi:hypothetical protein